MHEFQDHQRQTLRDELATDRYSGLSADEAYAELVARPNALRLARTVYRDDRGQVRKDVPGFPNKVRRSDFDLIWSEQHGAS